MKYLAKLKDLEFVIPVVIIVIVGVLCAGLIRRGASKIPVVGGALPPA